MKRHTLCRLFPDASILPIEELGAISAKGASELMPPAVAKAFFGAKKSISKEHIFCLCSRGPCNCLLGTTVNFFRHNKLVLRVDAEFNGAHYNRGCRQAF